MFSPLIIEKDDGVYQQKVLGEDIERRELNYIDTQLELKLAERNAKNNGICVEREELHNQLFDEIIIQMKKY